MANKRKDYSEAVRLYANGLSIQDVANFFAVTRQGMWDILKRRGVVFRSRLRYGKQNGFYRGGVTAVERAHKLFSLALEKGLIEKNTLCSVCGAENIRIEGHHDDYSKPLDVRWLCHACHYEWHKQHKAQDWKNPSPPMRHEEIARMGGTAAWKKDRPKQLAMLERARDRRCNNATKMGVL